MKFNEKIVALRKIKGITQDELASAVGVSRQAVYKWECGQSYPEVAKLIELKLLFNISIDDLLDENYEIALPEKKKRKRLPKAEKVMIENKVKEDFVKENITPPTEEPTVVTIEPEPEKEEAPAKVEDVAVSEPVEVKTEPVTVTATVAPAPLPAEEKKPASTEKKVGFFGRLFGRR